MAQIALKRIDINRPKVEHIWALSMRDTLIFTYGTHKPFTFFMTYDHFTKRLEASNPGWFINTANFKRETQEALQVEIEYQPLVLGRVQHTFGSWTSLDPADLDSR